MSHSQVKYVNVFIDTRVKEKKYPAMNLNTCKLSNYGTVPVQYIDVNQWEHRVQAKIYSANKENFQNNLNFL